MLKDVIAHVVNDLLSDLVGVFDLIAKAEGTVKCGKQCQKAVNAIPFMSLFGMQTSMTF